jgi:hypothetical protein
MHTNRVQHPSVVGELEIGGQIVLAKIVRLSRWHTSNRHTNQC